MTPRAAELDLDMLFARYHDRIEAHLRAMTRDPVGAEDLTQETFIAAHRHLHTLRDPDAAVAWLYRIATNRYLDRYRAGARRPVLTSLDESGEAASAQPRLDTLVEQADMSACVRGYLDDLPDDQRAAIVLHDLHGLTNPEIADLLDVPLTTVKIRVHRGREKLRDALRANCAFAHDADGTLQCEQA